MANSTIGSLREVQRGLEDALLGFTKILRDQGIGRRGIPFRPQILNVKIPSSSTMNPYPRWFPTTTRELTNLYLHGLQKFNPNAVKETIHTANVTKTFLNNSEVRKDVTIDIAIPYARVGRRGMEHHVRLTGPSIVDIFKKQNPMLDITPVGSRVIPLMANDFSGALTMANPWGDPLSVYHTATGAVATTVSTPIPDVFRVDFFDVERVSALMKAETQLLPQYAANAPDKDSFGGLLVFPRFVFPTRFSLKDADNTSGFPRYGTPGSATKLHPNVMDFYKYASDRAPSGTSPYTLFSNIYMTRHDGQPASDAAHVYPLYTSGVGADWAYAAADTPTGKTVDPNIIYSMIPADSDLGAAAFFFLISKKRLGATGSTVQSAWDVGCYDDGNSLAWPAPGILSTFAANLSSPSKLELEWNSTLPDTVPVNRAEVIRFSPGNHYRSAVGTGQMDVAVSIGGPSTKASTQAGADLETVPGSAAVMWFWSEFGNSSWPAQFGKSQGASLGRRADNLMLHFSVGENTLWSTFPRVYYGLGAINLYPLQENGDGTLEAQSTVDPENQIYPDWNNYYGRGYYKPANVAKRLSWGARMEAKPFKPRVASHRFASDHFSQATYAWKDQTTKMTPFFREVYFCNGLQPNREAKWYRRYANVKSGREVFLAVAGAGQRVFTTDASTPNSPTWREVPLPLLSGESIRGICEYKGFYLFYTLFGFYFSTDLMTFDYYQVIPDSQLTVPVADRPKADTPMTSNSFRWYVRNLDALYMRAGSENKWCIDNLKIIDGYIYAAVKTNCSWPAGQAATVVADRTFQYRIMRSKYPIFKQLYEYVTPYDVYMNHSFVDIYGKKQYGFKSNPEFLIGGARHHRLYMPQRKFIQASAADVFNILGSRKIYDNILKCIEFKGELYAIKFRFSMPKWLFEPGADMGGSSYYGFERKPMKSIQDELHLLSEVRLEKIIPGLANPDGTSYTETIWIMNRELCNHELGATPGNWTWNDYLVWGLYDLSNQSNVSMARCIPAINNQPYCYKGGFLASPANGSFVLEVIDGKLVLIFTCISDKYGIYRDDYAKYSATADTAGWEPSTNINMTQTRKMMVVFDGETVYQTDPSKAYLVNELDYSFFATKCPTWSTNYHASMPSDITVKEGDERSDMFYILTGSRSVGASTPSTSYHVNLIANPPALATIKAVAAKVTGTVDGSTTNPLVPPPFFLMPVTPFRPILYGDSIMNNTFLIKATAYTHVRLQSYGLKMIKEAIPTGLRDGGYDASDLTGQAIGAQTIKYIPNTLDIPNKSLTSSHWISMEVEMPTTSPTIDGTAQVMKPVFNGFKVIYDEALKKERILMLCGFTVYDITEYHAPYDKTGRTEVYYSSTERAVVLDQDKTNAVFNTACADDFASLYSKGALGQSINAYGRSHDLLPLSSNGSTLWNTITSENSSSLEGGIVTPSLLGEVEDVEYTIDIQYINGKYYQFLPGSIFVHERVPYYEPNATTVNYKWIHWVLWDNPLLKSTNSEDSTDITPNFNFWQINGRKPIYMNGYFFLPWCGLYVDLNGRTKSIPETSDFSPSERTIRFTNEGFMTQHAINQIGNQLWDNFNALSVLFDRTTNAPYSYWNDPDEVTNPLTLDHRMWHQMWNFSGWNQFYKCGNRLYAYTPSAIGSQIKYIKSAPLSITTPNNSPRNPIPYDMRPGCQEYIATVEYTGHKPQFFHKNINLWDYQYQYEQVNGPYRVTNHMTIGNKSYLMIDLPFHPTKVVVVSRDRKVVISEFREFQFDLQHGIFINSPSLDKTDVPSITISPKLNVPIETTVTGNAVTSVGRSAETDRYTTNTMTHAIRYEFMDDGGKVDLNTLTTPQESQIYPDELSHIDNNTIYIYNPKADSKGPSIRSGAFDSTGRSHGMASFYDQLPNKTIDGIRTDFGYRFNVIDVYAWC